MGVNKIVGLFLFFCFFIFHGYPMEHDLLEYISMPTISVSVGEQARNGIAYSQIRDHWVNEYALQTQVGGQPSIFDVHFLNDIQLNQYFTQLDQHLMVFRQCLTSWNIESHLALNNQFFSIEGLSSEQLNKINEPLLATVHRMQNVLFDSNGLYRGFNAQIGKTEKLLAEIVIDYLRQLYPDSYLNEVKKFVDEGIPGFSSVYYELTNKCLDDHIYSVSKFIWGGIKGWFTGVQDLSSQIRRNPFNRDLKQVIDLCSQGKFKEAESLVASYRSNNKKFSIMRSVYANHSRHYEHRKKMLEREQALTLVKKTDRPLPESALLHQTNEVIVQASDGTLYLNPAYEITCDLTDAGGQIVRDAGIPVEEFTSFHGSDEQNLIHKDLIEIVNAVAERMATDESELFQKTREVMVRCTHVSYQLNKENYVQVARETLGLLKDITNFSILPTRKMAQYLKQIVQDPVVYAKRVGMGYAHLFFDAFNAMIEPELQLFSKLKESIHRLENLPIDRATYKELIQETSGLVKIVSEYTYEKMNAEYLMVVNALKHLGQNVSHLVDNMEKLSLDQWEDLVAQSTVDVSVQAVVLSQLPKVGSLINRQRELFRAAKDIQSLGDWHEYVRYVENNIRRWNSIEATIEPVAQIAQREVPLLPDLTRVQRRGKVSAATIAVKEVRKANRLINQFHRSMEKLRRVHGKEFVDEALHVLKVKEKHILKNSRLFETVEGTSIKLKKINSNPRWEKFKYDPAHGNVVTLNSIDEALAAIACEEQGLTGNLQRAIRKGEDFVEIINGKAIAWDVKTARSLGLDGRPVFNERLFLKSVKKEFPRAENVIINIENLIKEDLMKLYKELSTNLTNEELLRTIIVDRLNYQNSKSGINLINFLKEEL